MKKFLLKLDDEQYRTVKWMAERLEISVSECLRAIIPSIKPRAAKVVSGKIKTAQFDDMVPTRRLSESQMQNLASILSQLTEKRWAVTLAKEISQQILHKAENKLTVNTYKRLAKWITPYRWTSRERFVKPKAEIISRILFDRPIERID